MENVLNIFILAFFGSIIALIGGVVFLFKKSWSDFLATYSIPFAAGVLITVALLGLLPEAIDLGGEGTLLVVLFAFLFSYLFESFFCDLHHHQSDCHHHHLKNSATLVIVGDTVHNFIDGLAIAATYFIDPGLSFITTMSTFLHEVPHEIGDFGILLKAGYSRQKVFWINFFSAATTLLGALFVILTRNEKSIAIMIAIAAGMFLYLGAADFLPQIHEEKISREQAFMALILGVGLMLLTIFLIPHEH